MKKGLCIVLLFSITFGLIYAESHPVFDLDSGYVISCTGLNVRDKPGLDGKVLGIIPFNEKVNVLDYIDEWKTIDDLNGSWTKVEWQTLSGWVFGGYLSDRPYTEISGMVFYQWHGPYNIPDYYFFKSGICIMRTQRELLTGSWDLRSNSVVCIFNHRWNINCVGDYDDPGMGYPQCEAYTIVDESVDMRKVFELSFLIEQGFSYNNDFAMLEPIPSQDMVYEKSFSSSLKSFWESRGSFYNKN